MTHDTPDGTDQRRLWCDTCGISVEPSTEDGSPECPSCGADL